MIKKRSRPEDPIPEGIYGLTGPSKTKKRPPKVTTSTKKAPKKAPSVISKKAPSVTVKKRSTRSLKLARDKISYVPDLDIKYDSLYIPDSVAGLPLDNVVALSDSLLRFVKSKTELRTKNLSNMILRSLVPSVLACEASLSYTKTFLESGFGFEMHSDQTIPDSLNDLIRLEVLTYFIKVSRLPRSIKVRLMNELSDKFAEQIVSTMKESLGKKKMEDRVHDMEAFVMRTRSDGKVTSSRKQNASENTPAPGPTSGRGAVKRRG